MKIRINEEYPNSGEDLNIVLDEYSNSEENINVILDEYPNKHEAFESNTSTEIEENFGYNDECYNATYYSPEENRFDVEIKYSEDENYAKTLDEKYSKYDKFCYENELENVVYEKDNYCSCEEKCEQYDEDIIISEKVESCPEEYILEDECNNSNQQGTPISSCNYNSVYINDCENNEDDYENECNKNYIYSNGRIEVIVKLGDRNGIEIKGAKVNLYELNGVCPKLYESKLTDCNGKIIFENLKNGCYRIISLVDRRFFEKPTYVTWNEVTIDDCVKNANIVILNKIKPSCLRR